MGALAESVSFVGMNFEAGSHPDISARIADRGGSFRYIVTPNVDHVVTIIPSKQERAARAYLEADLKVCDSRVLGILAQLVGIRLPVYPGSDITRDILDGRFGDLRIAVVGPSQHDFLALQSAYPAVPLIHVDTPERLTPDSEEWARLVQNIEAGEWDVALICLPIPLQQQLGYSLRNRGKVRGTALCVGAAVDFLTGKQTRAPMWMQNLALEWLFRLMTNPRRLWRRYLRGAIRIGPIFLRLEVLPRLRNAMGIRIGS
jgi:N-acetylglucosaminyldiphosphoundecaprenol N-acetyl-beta-D-mannosaminyltransferase